ncbi:MAG: hypothetical protein ABFS35_24125 [Bacteroidota bacterium]
MRVEIKEIELMSKDMFLYESYPGDGFYKVIYIGQPTPAELVFADGFNRIVIVVAPFTNVNNIEYEEKQDVKEEKKDGVVAESFALKMLSIATKNDKYKEL